MYRQQFYLLCVNQEFKKLRTYRVEHRSFDNWLMRKAYWFAFDYFKRWKRYQNTHIWEVVNPQGGSSEERRSIVDTLHTMAIVTGITGTSREGVGCIGMRLVTGETVKTLIVVEIGVV